MAEESGKAGNGAIGDLPMRPEWQAHIDELLEEYGRKRAQLKDLQEQMASVQATVTTEDEMITVTVGPQGRLIGLEFNPRAYRKYSTAELADAVLAAVQEATAQVGDQMRSAMQPMLPDQETVRNATGTGLDLSKLLPEHPEDLQAMRERYGFRDK